jgi:anti-anti-sigma factor
MEIAITAEAGLGKVNILGDMTIYTALDLKQQLQMVIADSAAIEIDLSQVNEMDTAGFQQLYLAKRESAGAGKPFRLTGQSPAAKELLDLYNMQSYFSSGQATR